MEMMMNMEGIIKNMTTAETNLIIYNCLFHMTNLEILQNKYFIE